jgi:hypothetical protein
LGGMQKAESGTRVVHSITSWSSPVLSNFDISKTAAKKKMGGSSRYESSHQCMGLSEQV